MRPGPRPSRTALISLSLSLAAFAGLAPESRAQSPDRVGRWRHVDPWPVAGIHSVLLSTGDVLQFSYPDAGPATGGARAYCSSIERRHRVRRDSDVDLFCGGHAALPDGRLLVAGCTIGFDPGGQFLGGRAARIFDPLTLEWSAAPDMAVGRYYPTCVALPDGRILVAGGLGEDGRRTAAIEIFHPDRGFERLPAADRVLPLYPWLHVLPSGLVFHSGPRTTTGTLDVETGLWAAIGTSRFGDRFEGSSVLLPGLDRVMIVGGGNENLEISTETAEIIDVDAPEPTWRYTSPMSARRIHANATLLPDGSVLVTGGEDLSTHDGVLEAEAFDPASETWTVLAPAHRPRLYHSTAILLPTGQVAVAGTDFDRTVDLFSPPYLFRGPRPRIDSAPATLGYGAAFSIETPAAGSVRSVVLMRPSAATHAYDHEQRLVDLAFSAGAPDRLDALSPPDARHAPPGFYMLFIVSDEGVPSRGRFVQLVP